MNKVFVSLIIILIFSCKEQSDQSVEPVRGVSLDLAKYRKTQVSEVRYNLSFKIPLQKEERIEGNLRLQCQVRDLSRALELDFAPDHKFPVEVAVNGKRIATDYRNEHLLIAAEYLILGENHIDIDFKAGEAALNRHTDYMFTLFVPDRARTLFPCFDQPDIKAKFKLTLSTPKDWKALTGGILENEKVSGDFIRREFGETDLTSTYLFSFVAGKYDQIDFHHANLKMKHFHREEDSVKINKSAQRIFQLHQHSLNFLEAYTQFKFPFQKFDFASIYSHPYGGMEHTGAVQYNQSRMFLDQSATQIQLLSRAKLIAHETSHMWFGNLVTMKWFDDVWLKEVFANFMADKIVNPAFADIDHDLHFMMAHYPSAYAIDRSEGANPIKQKLENLNEAGSLYGSIIYHKAPIMMRQLEALMGPDKFQQGIVDYINTYAQSNADWSDLIEIFDAHIEMDLNEWSEVWVHSSGRPVFNFSVDYDEHERITEFVISQKAEADSDKIWPQVFELDLIYPDSIQVVEIYSDSAQLHVDGLIGFPKPESVVFNSNGYGYGVFPVRDNEFNQIPGLENEVTRAHSYLNVYENTLLGGVEISKAMALFSLGLELEKNELILKRICNQVSHLFWYYLTEDERGFWQEKIEKVLLVRLLHNEKAGVKKALFALYQSIAYSKAGLENLFKVWNKELAYADLMLNQDDFTQLAMILAVYGHPESENILSEQRQQIIDPNKLERFDFLLPALSQDPEIRIAYFESFTKLENRGVESWVLTASYYMHHPLRQNEAIENLSLSLELFEEIQRTGDIFFPKNWLDNTIGMYTSQEAFELLEAFINTHPELNAGLKMKLLQATDDLRRNTELRTKE